jgi:hypothetical protein
MKVALCKERQKGTGGDLAIFEDRADEVELELIASFWGILFEDLLKFHLSI